MENELFSAKDVEEEMLASVFKNQSGFLCSAAEAAKGTRKTRETISLTFKWWVNEKGSIWVCSLIDIKIVSHRTGPASLMRKPSTWFKPTKAD